MHARTPARRGPCPSHRALCDPPLLADGRAHLAAYSVAWLHLHAMYPRTEMRRRWKYTPLSFKSPEWVLDRLERQALAFRPPGER